MQSPENKRTYYLNNKSQFKETQKRWNKRNPMALQAMSVCWRVKNRFPNNESTITSNKLLQWMLTQNKECKYCGDPATTVDHIMPLAKGGSHSLENLQMICPRCNHAKHKDLEKDFLDWLNRIKQRSEYV